MKHLEKIKAIIDAVDSVSRAVSIINQLSPDEIMEMVGTAIKIANDEEE